MHRVISPPVSPVARDREELAQTAVRPKVRFVDRPDTQELQELSSPSRKSSKLSRASSFAWAAHICDRSSLSLQMLEVGIPMTVSQALIVGAQMVTLSYIGHKMPHELPAIGLGLTIFNVFGISIGIGLTSALDTLSSQAFGRNCDSAEMGELLQRSIVVCLILALPISLLFIFCSGLLSLMFHDTLALGAARFLRASIPTLLLISISACVNRSLTSQRLTIVSMLGSATAVLIALIAGDYVVHDHVESAASALTIANIGNVVVTIMIGIVHPHCKWRNAEWPARNLLDGARMKEYFEVAIPSMLAVCAEWWTFEYLTVVAANVSDLAAGEITIIQNLMSILWAFPWGASVATNVLVGNNLGANRPMLARRAVRVGFLIGFASLFITISSMLKFSPKIFGLYTSDTTVIADLVACAPILAVSHFLDAVQVVYQGVYRGVGKQKRLMVVVLASQWLVGCPASTLFALKFGFGLRGIFLGQILGFLVECPIMLLECQRWDWHELAIQASHGEHPDSEVGEFDNMDDRVELEEVTTYSAVPRESSVSGTLP